MQLQELMLCDMQLKTVPLGGYMPSPRKTRRSIGGASFLNAASPRLSKWAMEDLGVDFQTKKVRRIVGKIVGKR